MRRWILLGVMAVVALNAGAARRVTVAELVQAVIADCTAHKPDAEIVRQFGGMELTERLSEATLDRLSAQVQLSPQVAVALELLASQSAFLDLPASELPAAPPPGEDAQLKIFNAAGTFVAETLPHLPNFLATRTTIRYDDSPQEVKKGAWPTRAGLHLVGTSSREISVSGERGNASGGKGSVRCAAFHYSVPKSASHFEVVSALQRQASVEGFASRSSGDRASSMSARPNDDSSRTSVMHAIRAYQGSLWVDPATGAILRITIEANSKDSSDFQWAEMLVEYGAVEIRDASFICPVHSVALSRTMLSADASTGSAASAWLNATVFSNYHRFAGTTRIINGADAAEPGPQKPTEGNTKPE